jgi:hypothetical protein
MAELELTASSAIDLLDPSNCLSIATAKPGQEIRVCVRSEGKLMEGVGTLSNDGKSFSVVVTREDGVQEIHNVSYRDLLKGLSDDD